MKEEIFEEIQKEINEMSSEQYWELYEQAKKLSDFPPVNLNSKEREEN